MKNIDIAEFSKLVRDELERKSTEHYGKELIQQTVGVGAGIQEKIDTILRSSLIYEEFLENIQQFPYVIFDENSGVNPEWKSHLHWIENRMLDTILREIGIAGIAEYYKIKIKLIYDKLVMVSEDILLITDGSRLILMNMTIVAPPLDKARSSEKITSSSLLGEKIAI